MPRGFVLVFQMNRARDHDALAEALIDSLGDSLFVARILYDPRCTIDSAALAGTEPPYDSLVAWLITDSSVAAGRRYLNQNRPFLDSLAERTGFPAELYVGIFRFETNFGQHLGMFTVFPALYSWYAAARSERSQVLWRGELAAALRLARAGIIRPFHTPSSRKGAWGLTQFMPSQYYLARDGDGDGRVDLFSERDALASTANHFLANGGGDTRRALLRTLHWYNRGPYGRALLLYTGRIRSVVAENQSGRLRRPDFYF